MGCWNTPGIYKVASCYHSKMYEVRRLKLSKPETALSHRRRWGAMAEGEKLSPHPPAAQQRSSQGDKCPDLILCLSSLLATSLHWLQPTRSQRAWEPVDGVHKGQSPGARSRLKRVESTTGEANGECPAFGILLCFCTPALAFLNI